MNKERIVRTICNIVTGVFVTAMVFVAVAISGLAESDEPRNDYGYFLWLLVWVIGFAMQFNKKIKYMGVVVTFIPALYFLFSLLEIL